MAFQFAGFLVPSDIEIIKLSALPAEAIFRPITTPFIGFGIKLPSKVGMTPSVEEVNDLAVATGIAQANSWLYLGYDTWGSIDWVYAIGSQNGKEFGPIDDSISETVETTYVEVMARIGVNAKNAHQFTPFVRGFWAPQS